MTQRNVREERRWAHYRVSDGTVTFVAKAGRTKEIVKANALDDEIVVRVTILVPKGKK